MRIGSLFSGIGGLDLAAEAAFGGRVVWHCEIERHPQRVLRRRWPDAELHADVRGVNGATVKPIDVLTGGFPCQDLSVAGKRAGLDGDRSGLYHEMLRIVGELKPQYVVFENVPPLLKYRHRVDNDLRELGYGAIWQTMAAEDVGAPHRRLRVWVLAVRGLAQWELLPRPSAQGDLFAPWVDAEAATQIWATPTATQFGGTVEQHLARKAAHGMTAAVTDLRLQIELAADGLWPTPTVTGNDNRADLSSKSGDGLATAAKAWPTPAARDWKDSGHEPAAQARNSPCLPASAVMSDNEPSGVLNPGWVELLMGYPTGWTDPDDDAAGAHAWPAGRGEQQHGHEPPRLVPPKSVRNRGARLKALGNAVVWQQARAAIERAQKSSR
jgi:site-specific DNA-cytosine methylase